MERRPRFDAARFSWKRSISSIASFVSALSNSACVGVGGDGGTGAGVREPSTPSKASKFMSRCRLALGFGSASFTTSAAVASGLGSAAVSAGHISATVAVALGLSREGQKGESNLSSHSLTGQPADRLRDSGLNHHNSCCLGFDLP